MKILKLFFFTLITTFGLSNCNTNEYEKKLGGGYYLIALHSMDEMSLGYNDGKYGIGIIPATIFSIGSNDNYILIKQHPRNFPSPSQKDVTNYFIIPVKSKISNFPEKNILGPLSKLEFDRKIQELSLQNLKFSLLFK